MDKAIVSLERNTLHYSLQLLTSGCSDLPGTKVPEGLGTSLWTTVIGSKVSGSLQTLLSTVIQRSIAVSCCPMSLSASASQDLPEGLSSKFTNQ